MLGHNSHKPRACCTVLSNSCLQEGQSGQHLSNREINAKLDTSDRSVRRNAKKDLYCLNNSRRRRSEMTSAWRMPLRLHFIFQNKIQIIKQSIIAAPTSGSKNFGFEIINKILMLPEFIKPRFKHVNCIKNNIWLGIKLFQMSSALLVK